MGRGHVPLACYRMLTDIIVRTGKQKDLLEGVVVINRCDIQVATSGSLRKGGWLSWTQADGRVCLCTRHRLKQILTWLYQGKPELTTRTSLGWRSGEEHDLSNLWEFYVQLVFHYQADHLYLNECKRLQCDRQHCCGSTVLGAEVFHLPQSPCLAYCSFSSLAIRDCSRRSLSRIKSQSLKFRIHISASKSGEDLALKNSVWPSCPA